MAIFVCLETALSLFVQVNELLEKSKSSKRRVLEAKKTKLDESRGEDIIALSSSAPAKRENMVFNFRLEEIIVDFTEVAVQLAVHKISLDVIRHLYDLQLTAGVGTVTLKRKGKKRAGLAQAILSCGSEDEPFLDAKLLVCTPRSLLYRENRVHATVKMGAVVLSFQKAVFTKDLVEKVAEFAGMVLSRAKELRKLGPIAVKGKETTGNKADFALSLVLPRVLLLVDTRFSVEVKDISLVTRGLSKATILFGEILFSRKEQNKEQYAVLRVKEEKLDRTSIVTLERTESSVNVKVRICEVSCFYDKFFWSPALIWPITLAIPHVEQLKKKLEGENDNKSEEVPDDDTQKTPISFEAFVQSANVILPGRIDREAPPAGLDAPERWGKFARIALGNIFVVFGADPKDAALRALRCTLKAGLTFENARKDTKHAVLAPTQVSIGVSLPDSSSDVISASIYAKLVLRITPKAVVGISDALAYNFMEKSQQSNKRDADKRVQPKKEKSPRGSKATKLALSLRIPHMCAKLENKGGCELAELDVDGLCLALAKRGTDELTVGLEVEQVFFMDRRGGANKELVYCKRRDTGGGKGDDERDDDDDDDTATNDADGAVEGGDGKVEEPAGILLWVSIAPDTGSSRVSLRVGSVGVSVVPDFMYDVVSLFDSVGAKVRDTLAGPAKPEKSRDGAANAQSAGADLELVLNTGHILVLLTSPESEIRCTVCGVHAKYAKQNGSSDLVGLVLGVEVFHSFEMRAPGYGRKRGGYGAMRVTQPLLVPFDVNVKFACKKGLQPAFFVGLTPIKISFSPQDAFRLFKLFNDAIDSIPKRPNEGSSVVQSPTKKHDPGSSIIVNK